MNLGHILFSFSGRINRAKWWLSVLVTFIIAIVVVVLTEVVKSDPLTIALNLAYTVISLWIGLAAGAKRLHDLNRSGAWLIFFIGAPFLLTIIFLAVAGVAVGTGILTGQTPSEAEMLRIGWIGIVYILAILGIGIWSLIWFGCLRGTVGPNQYGPDPLEGKI